MARRRSNNSAGAAATTADGRTVPTAPADGGAARRALRSPPGARWPVGAAPSYARGRALLACCTSSCSQSKSLLRCGARRWSCGHLAVGLAGTSPRALAGDHVPALEDLPAPDSPGLATLEGAGEAGETGRAVPAVLLGQLQVGRVLGEPQIRVLDPARHVVGTLRRDRIEQPR